METKNEDINVLDKVVRENLSFMSIVEKPYFFCNFLKKCVFSVVLLKMLPHQWIHIQSAIRIGVRKRKMY